MLNLTPQGQQIVSDVASRYGVSEDAVRSLLSSINAGYGTQAQFNIPELGGMGQWSQGGMTMVGDMFNHGLKNTVNNLCSELSSALASNQIFQPIPQAQMQGSSSGQSQSQSSGFGSGNSFFVSGGMQGGSGWPQELGSPSSTGSQNNLRYAVFPQTRRLAIDNNGQIKVYDIGDHQIGGFSQQQSGDQSITFTSQYGIVRVADLPEVSLGGGGAPAPQAAPVGEPVVDPAPQQPASGDASGSPSSDEIFGLIEKLAALHQNGILSDSEYETKKSELLARL